jgi:hypothetical protein
MTRAVLLILAAIALAGCATTPDANYSAYIEANARADQQAAIAHAALADAAACNGDPTCVVSVKAMASMAVQAGGNRAPIQQHVRQPGAAESITRDIVRAVPGVGNVLATIEGIKANRDIARYNTDGRVRELEAWGELTGRVADSHSSRPPSYQIGGDYVTGQVGDNVGRDQIGGNQHLGDWRTGDDVRRDTAGRDQTDYGTGNRLWSAGPYDWTDVGNEGPRCTGIGCQTVNPEPEDEEPEE